MTYDARRGSIGSRVHELRKEAINLKTAQFTGWDSIRCYNIETTRAYDLSYTPTYIGGQLKETLGIYVKFIADHQDAPFAKPTMDILINNRHHRVGMDGVGNTSEYSDYGVYTNGWVSDTYGNYSPTRTPNNTKELSWYNSISTYSPSTLQIKIKVFATDTGRIIARYVHSNGEGLFIE